MIINALVNGILVIVSFFVGNLYHTWYIKRKREKRLFVESYLKEYAEAYHRQKIQEMINHGQQGELLDKFIKSGQL